MRSFGCTRMNKQRHFACYWLTIRTKSYFYTCIQLFTDLTSNSLVLSEKQNCNKCFKFDLIDYKKVLLLKVHMIKNSKKHAQ